MKRQLIMAIISVCAAPSAFPASGTWTGKISDSTCGVSHLAESLPELDPITDSECTMMCVKGGEAKYVLVSGGKVYAIANQDDNDLALFAGHTVDVAGDLQGMTISVSKICSRSGKRAPKKN